MQVAPTEAMSRGAHEHRARLRWRRGLAWSAVFARLAAAASRKRAAWSGYPVGGYVAALSGDWRGGLGRAGRGAGGQSRHSRG